MHVLYRVMLLSAYHDHIGTFLQTFQIFRARLNPVCKLELDQSRGKTFFVTIFYTLWRKE